MSEISARDFSWTGTTCVDRADHCQMFAQVDSFSNISIIDHHYVRGPRIKKYENVSIIGKQLTDFAPPSNQNVQSR